MTGKDIFKIAMNLVVIYVIGGVLLAGVYAWTSPIIFINKKEDKEAALKRMMPLHFIVNAPADAMAGIKELLPGAKETEQGSVDVEVDLEAAVLDPFVSDPPGDPVDLSGASEACFQAGNLRAPIAECLDDVGPVDFIRHEGEIQKRLELVLSIKQ